MQPYINLTPLHISTFICLSVTTLMSLPISHFHLHIDLSVWSLKHTPLKIAKRFVHQSKIILMQHTLKVFFISPNFIPKTNHTLKSILLSHENNDGMIMIEVIGMNIILQIVYFTHVRSPTRPFPSCRFLKISSFRNKISAKLFTNEKLLLHIPRTT